MFQNEGQSEFAEVIMGYNARYMQWLDEPEEVDGTVEVESGPEGLYRWRRGSNDVLLDYQRAQLVHSYVNERTDPETTASITRASSGGRDAYMEALDEYEISWPEFLTDFQITNRLNNADVDEGQYGYSLFQFEEVRADGIGTTHSPPLARASQSDDTDNEVVVRYGGGYYSLFEDPGDLKVEIEGDDYVNWGAIITDGESESEVRVIEERTEEFEGQYEEIVLVGINTMEEGGDEENPGSRQYSYSFEHGVVSHTAEEDELPENFHLYEAYPNPFNPLTTIEYQLPKSANVRLDVYDVTGRRVSTLVNDPQQAGIHQVNYEADELSSGTYIYRIQAGNWVESKKMLFMK